MIFNYTHNNLVIEFHYEYEKGEPEIHTYSNGDPGYPGSAPAVTIHPGGRRTGATRVLKPS